MLSELNEKLRKTQYGMLRLQKINAMLKGLNAEKYELEQKVSALSKVLEKENEDVRRLENNSITAYLYSILGNRAEKTENERKEALAAQFKYNQAVNDLQHVKDQIGLLTEEKKTYADCEKEYGLLYEQKKQYILNAPGPAANELFRLSNENNEAQCRLKELDEASAAGRDVCACLNRAEQNLKSAKGWGTWDLLGGGLIADIAKHSSIDDAMANTQEAQMLLRRFKTELMDIKIDGEIQMETGGFAKFADFFFDGLIADWVMQTKINQSMESVTQVKIKVTDILNKLELLRMREQENVTKTKDKMNSLIQKEN